jgi:hypothetical protein
MPDLLPVNRDAVRIWEESRTQVIVGMAGIVDINILAVTALMDIYPGGIRNKWDCLQRVRILFDEYRTILEEQNNAKPKD